MREIKFRAFDVRGNRMIDIVGFVLANNEIRIWYFVGESLVNESFKPSLLILRQFTGLHDKNGTEIYEGDIVKVLTNRMPTYGNQYQPASQYDKRKIESRSVVVFERYEWRLDIKNAFNTEIVRLRGKETDDRHLTLHTSLGDYDFFQSSEFNREKNTHCYWFDIEVIGNVDKNPELLWNA